MNGKIQLSFFASPYLYDLLLEQDLKIWLMFVDACKLLYNHFISKSNAKKAADLLLEFNKCVKDSYGVEACTMNMHLHCHL